MQVPEKRGITAQLCKKVVDGAMIMVQMWNTLIFTVMTLKDA